MLLWYLHLCATLIPVSLGYSETCISGLLWHLYLLASLRPVSFGYSETSIFGLLWDLYPPQPKPASEIRARLGNCLAVLRGDLLAVERVARWGRLCSWWASSAAGSWWRTRGPRAAPTWKWGSTPLSWQSKDRSHRRRSSLQHWGEEEEEWGENIVSSQKAAPSTSHRLLSCLVEFFSFVTIWVLEFLSETYCDQKIF